MRLNPDDYPDYSPLDAFDDDVITVSFEVTATVRVVGDYQADSWEEEGWDEREFKIIDWEQYEPQVIDQITSHINSNADCDNTTQHLPTLKLTFNAPTRATSTI